MVKLNDTPEVETEFESDTFESDEWETYEDDDDVDYEEGEEAPAWMKYGVYGGIGLAILIVIIVFRMMSAPATNNEPTPEVAVPDATSIISESVVDVEMPEEEPEQIEYTYKVPDEQLTPGENDEVFKASIQLGGGTKASNDDRQLVYNAVMEQFEAIKKGVQTGAHANLKMDNKTAVDRLAMIYNSGYDVVPASFTVFEGTTTEMVKYVVLFEKGEDKVGIFGQYNKSNPLIIVDGMVDEESAAEESATEESTTEESKSE